MGFVSAVGTFGVSLTHMTSMYVCMYIRMYVHTYVCMYVCMCMHQYIYSIDIDTCRLVDLSVSTGAHQNTR